MIYFVDDFLPEDVYSLASKNLLSSPFEAMVVGDKTFHVKFPSKDFQKNVTSRIENMEGKTIKNILGFFRTSTDVLDTDWRIHSDLNINGQKPDRAVVLFMSPKPDEAGQLSGTALWEHVDYGHTLPTDTSDQEFDEVLIGDSNDLSKWKLNTVIGHRENRIISYPSAYFHSKFPDKSWEAGRIVFVMFYKHE